jgi:Tol biopolymer transport system component
MRPYRVNTRKEAAVAAGNTQRIPAREGWSLLARMVATLTVVVGVGAIAAADYPAGAASAGVNGKIAFRSDRDGNAEIYAMNPDGSGVTNLTQSPARDLSPAWSPGGSKIAYMTDLHDPGSNLQDYYVMNADGSGPTRLTHNSGVLRPPRPTWSPNGSRVAYTSNNPGRFEIWVMNADGSDQTQLTEGEDWSPEWSPDGSKITYTHRVNFPDDDVYVMNPDGTGRTNLTTNPAADFGSSWSPDGQKILFASDRDGDTEVYVMNADGSGQTRLTESPGNDVSPVWSPDGLRIAFASDRDGNLEIYVMNPDGSSPTRLTNNPASDGVPHWQTLAPPPFPQPPPPPPAKPRYALTVVKSGTGAGTIRSLPGIDCGADCAEDYDAGTTVTLIATAAAGSRFGTWGGACSGISTTCTLTVDTAETVNAVFIRSVVVTPRRCIVPRVTGLPLSRARARIRRANCAIGRVRYAYASRPRGRVIAQHPRPGTRLRRGGRVNVRISRGRR